MKNVKNVGLNEKSGAIIEDNGVTLIQESWDGKSESRIYLSKEDILKLASEVQDEN